MPQACALVRNDRVGDGAGSPGCGGRGAPHPPLTRSPFPRGGRFWCGADSPGCGVRIGCVLRGRFVKRPYIRFSKLRMRRSLSGFQVWHARAVEDASPYGGRRVRCGFAGMRRSWCGGCNCIHLYTNVYQIQIQTQPRRRPYPAQIQIQTQKHPQTQKHIHPHSQKESGAGLLKTSEAVENRKRAVLVCSADWTSAQDTARI